MAIRIKFENQRQDGERRSAIKHDAEHSECRGGAAASYARNRRIGQIMAQF